MTTYYFRVKYERDPRGLWRDIAVGAETPLHEFRAAINRAVGLDDDHLWFFGTDRDYWDSDVRFECPEAITDSPGLLGVAGDEARDATGVTLATFVDYLGLSAGDRCCYLYDYGDEWRFYALLKDVRTDGDGDRDPEVKKSKGEVLDQYDRSF